MLGTPGPGWVVGGGNHHDYMQMIGLGLLFAFVLSCHDDSLSISSSFLPIFLFLSFNRYDCARHWTVPDLVLFILIVLWENVIDPFFFHIL